MRRILDILAIGLLLGFFLLGLYGNPVGQGQLYLWISLGVGAVLAMGWLLGLFRSTYENLVQEFTRVRVAHTRKKWVDQEKPSVEEAFDALKKRDWKTAAHGIWKEAEYGDLECQYRLSHLFRYGRGVPRSPRDGFRWLERSAEAGHVDAEAELGDAWRSGYAGAVKPDGDKAMSWLRRASLHGHDGAKLVIGRMFERGELVHRDFEEASNWYRRAAERGLAHAQQALGKMYLRGRGVPKDNIQAAVWFGLAERQKKPGVNAARDLHKATKDLKGEQIQEVRNLAGAWNERMVKTDFEKQEEFRRVEREKIRKLARPFVDRVREELERLKEQTKDAILPPPEEQKALPGGRKGLEDSREASGGALPDSANYMASSADSADNARRKQAEKDMAKAEAESARERKKQEQEASRKPAESESTVTSDEKEAIKARLRNKAESGPEVEQKALNDLKDQMRKMKERETRRKAEQKPQDAGGSGAAGGARPDKQRPAAAQAMLDRLKKEQGGQQVRKNLRDRKTAKSESDDAAGGHSSARLTRTRRGGRDSE